jgi:hypothetical protein
MIVLYGTLFFFSLPSLVIYYSGNAFLSTRSSEFKSFLAQFTIGNIGQATSACNSAQMVTTTNPESINLFCTYGYMSSILEFGQTLVDMNPSCKSDMYFTPDHCSYTGSMSKESTQRLVYLFNANCLGKTQCTITLDTTLIPNNCTTGY